MNLLCKIGLHIWKRQIVDEHKVNLPTATGKVMPHISCGIARKCILCGKLHEDDIFYIHPREVFPKRITPELIDEINMAGKNKKEGGIVDCRD